jgi:protocatechuate 3,4-dioxygenase beta subunit
MLRFSAWLLMAVWSFAQAQTRPPTPADMLGPFYPDVLPVDRDNDLTRIAGAAAAASGKVIEIGGRVVDTGGRPLAGVRIEIWQTDANGRYIHSQDNSPQARDPNFQGFGATVAAADGGWRFRTVVPLAYASRPAHIHARVVAPSGRVLLVTQLYFPGAVDEPGLPARLRGGREAGQTLRLEKGADGSLRGSFDFVLPAAR